MSFIFLLLYIFCMIIRPQDWMPGFVGLRIVNALAIATIICLFFERMGIRTVKFVKVPQNKLMVWFFIAILLSHVRHFYLGGMIMGAKMFIVNLILYFIIVNAIDTERKFKITIWFMVILIFALVPQGIYQIENIYGWAGQKLTMHGGYGRINWIGIFNDPNDLALLFVVAVGFVLSFMFGRKDYFLKLISMSTIGFFMYGIYLTNSRGGVLAVMTTVYFYFVKRTGKLFWGGIIGGALAFGVLILGPSRTGLISVSEDSAYSRMELWYEGIQLLKANPIFGRGFNMFTDALPQTAHNSFILAAAELGMFGLFLWVALLYVSYKGLTIIQKNDKRLYNYSMGVQAGLVGFCAAAYFLSRTYVIIPYLFFALSGSLMHIAKKRNPDLDFSFTKKDKWNVFYISIGTLLLALSVIKFGL